MMSGMPRVQPAVPLFVAGIAAGRPTRTVWQNELGGLTFQIDEGTARQFLKWVPAGCGIDFAAEVQRLRWAGAFTPVPRVLDQGADPSGPWILTEGLGGLSAVDERWRQDPATAVRGIGEGLRALHEALPVAECPFDWSASARADRGRSLAVRGLIDPARWAPEHRQVSAVERAFALLADVPPIDVLVVCHGDACAPNTVIGPDGKWSGHVDLGSLGVADRWADLAVATWSTQWNYGTGWESALLDAYGVARDEERIRYYRLLWDVVP